MTRCIYIASSEGQTGKSAVALGIIDSLKKAGHNVGIFRPIVKDTHADDISATLASDMGQPVDIALGVSYAAMHDNQETAIAEIIERYDAMAAPFDVVAAVGSDWTDVSTTTEAIENAKVAANLSAGVILIVNAWGRTATEVRVAAESSMSVFASENVPVLAVIANRAASEVQQEILAALEGLAPFVDVIREDARVSAPSVRAKFDVLGAKLLSGTDERLDQESTSTIVCGMTVQHALENIYPGATVIAASDREDLIEAILTIEQEKRIAGLILVGGYPVAQDLEQRIEQGTLPVAITPMNSFWAATKVAPLFGYLSPKQAAKIDAARERFATDVDADALVKVIEADRTVVRTPLAFVHQLTEMAKANLKTIVLPESSDDRILQSAAIVNARGTAKIILLGEAETINARAAGLKLDLGDVQIVSPNDPELVEKFAQEYATLRAKKGVTLEQARETLQDLSYFGTMMIHFGMADGMVSGAVNTTANTIKPSFEFIKTKPGVKVVSSSFLMCMPDRVLAFGDCAVNPNPNPEELADIAVSCAKTAERFGIEPRVAMLSYSTAGSGKGPDVDAVVEATRVAHQIAPELKLDGPIQFDAAMDPTVGQKKMPGSEVAGQATVYIFPSLEAGNIAYKAVQRTSGALAIGPILQGLNKPVNDLSRGALVDDIVNTIAITAIQAQDDDAQ